MQRAIRTLSNSQIQWQLVSMEDLTEVTCCTMLLLQACHQESGTRRVLRLLRTAVEITMTTSINQIYFVYFETLVFVAYSDNS